METLTEMVKSYLDSQELKYVFEEAEEEDDRNGFYLGINHEHEYLKVLISLDDKRSTYAIICVPDLEKTVEAELEILKAINAYNCRRSFIRLVLKSNGELCFAIEGVIQDISQGEKIFIEDFIAVLEDADKETAQILRHAEHKSGGVFAKLFGR